MIYAWSSSSSESLPSPISPRYFLWLSIGQVTVRLADPTQCQEVIESSLSGDGTRFEVFFSVYAFPYLLALSVMRVLSLSVDTTCSPVSPTTTLSVTLLTPCLSHDYPACPTSLTLPRLSASLNLTNRPTCTSASSQMAMTVLSSLFN